MGARTLRSGLIRCSNSLLDFICFSIPTGFLKIRLRSGNEQGARTLRSGGSDAEDKKIISYGFASEDKKVIISTCVRHLDFVRDGSTAGTGAPHGSGPSGTCVRHLYFVQTCSSARFSPIFLLAAG